MEVIWTRQAIQMVNDFVNYIAQVNYKTAEQWALELMSQTDKLADHPRIGRVVPEYNEESLRELIVGNYRLPYRIREDRIYIEAVWYISQIPPHKD